MVKAQCENKIKQNIPLKPETINIGKGQIVPYHITVSVKCSEHNGF